MPLVHLPINTVAFERLCIPARGVPRLRRGRNWDSICRSRTFQVRGAPRAWRNGSAEVGIGIQSVAHVPSRYAGLLAPGETAPPRSELGFNLSLTYLPGTRGSSRLAKRLRRGRNWDSIGAQ